MKSPFARTLSLLFACLSCVIAVQAGQPANGNVTKQVAEGRALVLQGETQKALDLFRQAAAAGDVEGAFLAGNILLKDAKNCQGRDRVFKATESLGYLFTAATNLHPQACAGLSYALQNGIGTRKDLCAAYAWMRLAAEHDVTLRSKLDELAVKIAPGEIRRGQELAREYISVRWPVDLGRSVDQNDARLRVQGVTSNSTRPMVVINNATFSAGDTEDVRPANSAKNDAGRLSIRCLEIGEDYVLVSVSGEPHLKLLALERQFSSR